MPLGSTGRLWRSWGSWITGAFVAIAAAVTVFVALPTIRGMFPPALLLIAISGAAVALFVGGVALFLWDPFARLWRNVAAASAAICVTALITLGLVQAVQVGVVVT